MGPRSQEESSGKEGGESLHDQVLREPVVVGK